MKSLDDVIAIVSKHKNILKEKYKVNNLKEEVEKILLSNLKE